MGILELLTITFVLLKAFGIISWSWLLVFTPLIIAISFYVISFILVSVLGIMSFRRSKK